MKLSEMQVQDFAREVASGSPAPGGGSVAALAGAIGVGLTVMVACLTQGRKKYEAFAPFAAQAEEEGKALQEKLLDVMERDTLAFNAVSAAFALPKEDEARRLARSAAIQAALKGCTETPLEMMRLGERGLLLTEALLNRGYNLSSASDLGVAALNLRSALQGAWLNVLINLGSIKDPDYCAAARKEGEDILSRCLPKAEGIYQRVLEQL